MHTHASIFGKFYGFFYSNEFQLGFGTGVSIKIILKGPSNTEKPTRKIRNDTLCIFESHEVSLVGFVVNIYLTHQNLDDIW